MSPVRLLDVPLTAALVAAVAALMAAVTMRMAVLVVAVGAVQRAAAATALVAAATVMMRVAEVVVGMKHWGPRHTDGVAAPGARSQVSGHRSGAESFPGPPSRTYSHTVTASATEDDDVPSSKFKAVYRSRPGRSQKRVFVPNGAR